MGTLPAAFALECAYFNVRPCASCRGARPTLNGFSLLVLIVLLAGIPLGFRAGMLRERRDALPRGSVPRRRAQDRDAGTMPTPQPTPPADAALAAEHARLIRSAAVENAALRRERMSDSAELSQLRAFAAERRILMRDLADARTEIARYREIVVDLEDNAPPLLLDAPNAPDDLKLIVGVGPVLERMLQRLGIGSYRQIARWSDHDIDTFDARLPEFRGRIRRDGWVTQARSLHQSKYGERPY
jgi:predicted flap endonuclease-1-like 5' DNA nuclease